MFPSKFDYVAPHSIEEVVDLLSQRGDEAKLLAGGQSLIPLMKLRFAAPELIVDLERVPGLAHIDETPDGLHLGPLSRHNELVASAVLKRRYPLMAAAAPQISDPVVRNRGTIGGSLAHADPAGDWGSVMLALGADLVVRSSSGERTIPVEDFFVGTFTTALEPTEVMTEVRVRRPGDRSGGAYLKLERKIGDFATVGVAVQLELADGSVSHAGIGLTAVGPQNIKARAAEDLLVGSEPSAEAFDEAARAAADTAEPTSDVRGSADYKRAVVRAYVKQGLSRALDIAHAA
jgi:carbon-monoxide dehydrogenase medium subunit